MSLALRHEPARFGITLDAEGWTPLPAFAAALRITVADVEAVLAMPGKQRFEVSGGRIRARYGHSVAERVAHQPAEPPGTLFHGTTRDAVPAILREGLRPMGRQYVHLAAALPDAVAVGSRRRREVAVLLVAARDAWRDGGVAFYDAGRGVWLADAVPPRYLSEK